MGKILNGYILPHPPILIPEIGGGREEEAAATIKAMKKAAKEIAEDKPDTIILSSPHAPCFRDYVYFTEKEQLFGSFGGFGHPEVALSFQNNLSLGALIKKHADHAGIPSGSLSGREKELYGITDILDHGALVPLYFIQKEWKDFRLVLISTPFLPLKEIYRFGQAIGEAVKSTDERIVYVASGDLSHRLIKEAPAGYHPKGREYDEKLIELLEKNQVDEILQTEEKFMEAAGECGTRSVVMMLGVFNGQQEGIKVYHYEGPYGVGYLVAKGILNHQSKEEKEFRDNER